MIKYWEEYGPSDGDYSIFMGSTYTMSSDGPDEDIVKALHDVAEEVTCKSFPVKQKNKIGFY